jgi:hypothetical protein
MAEDRRDPEAQQRGQDEHAGEDGWDAEEASRRLRREGD